MPQPAVEMEDEEKTKRKDKSKHGKESKLKKISASNKDRMVLVQVNMLDGTVSNYSIEVS